MHVHLRRPGSQEKVIDGSFDIVLLEGNGELVLVEAMSAQAFAVSDLMEEAVVPLPCRRCGQTHTDELKFAARRHRKHQCDHCGRAFWHDEPSISNPLADAHAQLGLPEPLEPAYVDRPLHISSSDYDAIAIWPTNRAIVTNAQRRQERGAHVHAGSASGERMVDETYWPVWLDGDLLDERLLRMLAVQRLLASKARVEVTARRCHECASPMLSPTSGWLDPVARHRCVACGAVTRTRRRCFLNPLAGLVLATIEGR